MAKKTNLYHSGKYPFQISKQHMSEESGMSEEKWIRMIKQRHTITTSTVYSVNTHLCWWEPHILSVKLYNLRFFESGGNEGDKQRDTKKRENQRRIHLQMSVSNRRCKWIKMQIDQNEINITIHDSRSISNWNCGLTQTHVTWQLLLISTTPHTSDEGRTHLSDLFKQQIKTEIGRNQRAVDSPCVVWSSHPQFLNFSNFAALLSRYG